MSIKVAVTGASGHIGNVVCRNLLERGFQIKALYNSDKRSLEGLALECIQGNVLNLENLHSLVEHCEVVINCAAIISIDGDPDGMVFKTNTQGPANILKASLDKGVKKIIHLSSVHAVTELPHSVPYDESRPYKNALHSAYDYSKAQGEQILLNGSKGLPIEVVILRPSCVIGPHDYKPSKMGSALIDFYHEKIPFLPPGGYDLVDVRDVAEAVVASIEKGRNGEVYLLSGKYYDFKQLAKIIYEVTGKETPRRVIPYWLLKGMVPLVSFQSKLSGSSKSITHESIEAVKNGHPAMNHSKAKKELGYQNRQLTNSLHDYYNWQKNQQRIM